MKYVDEYRNNEQVQALVRAIRKATTQTWHIMEICGGQTHAIARYRLEEMLPEQVRLLHGPGLCHAGYSDRPGSGISQTPRCHTGFVRRHDACTGNP